MDVFELMKQRHSVRQYKDIEVEVEKRRIIDDYVNDLNAKADLHMQCFYDEKKCFDHFLAHYGKFENASNYLSLVGKRADDLDERCGYYGELVVLKLQELGLNSCWVALSHGKSKAVIDKEEKEVVIIAFGYGENQGHSHKSKEVKEVCDDFEEMPDWFQRGVEAALLAPTAVNQQKFRFVLFDDHKVKIIIPKIGSCLKIDKGIVKCHFELAAGKENFHWIE